jgi:hypothetical protein
VALLVVLFVVALGSAAWAGQSWTPSSAPLTTKPTQVIVFGVAPLGFDNLGQGRTPNLDRLVTEGAVAAMSTRTAARHSSVAEGYLAIGAGFRVRVGAGAGEAYEADEVLPAGPVASVYEEAFGRPLDGRIAVLGGEASVDRNSGNTISSHPGALGQALRDAGLSTAVVGNADLLDPETGQWTVNRPAALALMDEELTVADGEVGAVGLLMDDPLAPYGRRADGDAVVSAVERFAASSDVVFVDPGDLYRAVAFAGTLPDEEARAAVRAQALEQTDELLGRVLTLADDDTMVMVVSVASGGGLRLAPVAFVGGGIEPGYLVSPSVKRTGLLAITDLAPTILDVAGVPVPEEMPGNAVRARPDTVDLERLRDLDRDTAFRERTYYGWTLGFIQAHALVYAVGLVIICAGIRLRGIRELLRLAALGLAAFPLATFLFRMIPDGAETGDSAVWIVLLIDAVVAVVASRLRRTPLSALLLVLGATLAVIMVDASTGTRLHVNSWLGYSLHGGGRFYGIPNTTYALLAAAGLLVTAGLVHFGARRQEAVLAGGLLLALVVVVDGAPSLGGDVGGIVSLVPVFAVVLVALADRRLRPRTVLLIGVATLAVLGAAIGIDLLRPPDARTHLGRWVTDVADDGIGTIWDTFSRKQSANWRILQNSIWAWMIPVTGVFLGAVLWSRERRTAVLPPRSAAAIGVVGTLACAVVGFLANDSGPIVVGLFFSVLLPFVLLLALDAPPRPGAARAATVPDPEEGREADQVEPEPALTSR